jgi:hypothetical protein
MLVQSTRLGIFLLLLWLCPARAASFYFDLNGFNPAPACVNWATAIAFHFETNCPAKVAGACSLVSLAQPKIV